MQWCDFYDCFWDWADSTRRTRISSLTDIGSGEEIVEAVLEIEEPKIRSQLIRKAMKLGAKFTSEDFQNLECELPDEVYAELAAYAGFSVDCPDYDKDDHTWEYFYDNCSIWTEEIQLQAIAGLHTIGKPEEIVDVVSLLEDSAQTALIRRVLARNIVFSADELEELGCYISDDLMDALYDKSGISQDEPYIEKEEYQVAVYVPEKEDPPKLPPKEQRWEDVKGILGFLSYIAAVILGVLALLLYVIIALTKPFLGGKRSSWGRIGRKKKSRYCDGDCANCPPHYGYRYGRWYYGHGHRWGCERGGNGGLTGRTSRD